MSQAGVNLRPVSPLVTRARKLAELAPAEVRLLEDLFLTSREYTAQTELAVENCVQPPRVILSGWAFQQRLLGNGRRQIIRFLLPGDMVGSIFDAGAPASAAVVALTPVRLASALPLLPVLDRATAPFVGLAGALWHMHRAAELGLHDQIVRLGRQAAYERMLHLAVELHSRLDDIGQVNDNAFDFPLTQEILADALGMSLVHVNRTLQQIRREYAIEWRSGRLILPQLDAMKKTADWNA